MAWQVVVFVLATLAKVRGQLATASQPAFRTDVYTALVPVDIRCVNDPDKGLSCSAAYPANCQERWDYPNPCTAQTVTAGTVLKYVHPFDASKFLVCGLHGRLFVEQCPYQQVFHEGCGECVDDYTIMSSNCQNLTVSQEYVENPCTKANIDAGKLFFPFAKNISKYIHCDIWGKAWERDCTPGEVWSEFDVACVDPNLLNPCGNPIADITFMYSHPCDPLKYIRCDVDRNAYEISCPSGEAFHEVNQKCEAVERFYRPLENICHGSRFAFRDSTTLPSNLTLLLAQYKASQQSLATNEFGTMGVHASGLTSGQTSTSTDMAVGSTAQFIVDVGQQTDQFGPVLSVSDMFVPGASSVVSDQGTTSVSPIGPGVVNQQFTIHTGPSMETSQFDISATAADSSQTGVQSQTGFDQSIQANLIAQGTGQLPGTSGEMTAQGTIFDQTFTAGTVPEASIGSTFAGTNQGQTDFGRTVKSFGTAGETIALSDILAQTSATQSSVSSGVASAPTFSDLTGHSTVDFGTGQQLFGTAETAVSGNVFDQASPITDGTGGGSQFDQAGSMSTSFDFVTSGPAEVTASGTADTSPAAFIIQKKPPQANDFLVSSAGGNTFEQTDMRLKDSLSPAIASDIQSGFDTGVSGDALTTDMSVPTSNIGSAAATSSDGSFLGSTSGISQGQDIGVQGASSGDVGAATGAFVFDTFADTSTGTVQGQSMGFKASDTGGEVGTGMSGNFVGPESGTVQTHDMSSQTPGLGVGVETGVSGTFVDSASGTVQGQDMGFQTSSMAAAEGTGTGVFGTFVDSPSATVQHDTSVQASSVGGQEPSISGSFVGPESGAVQTHDTGFQASSLGGQEPSTSGSFVGPESGAVQTHDTSFQVSSVGGREPSTLGNFVGTESGAVQTNDVGFQTTGIELPAGTPNNVATSASGTTQAQETGFQFATFTSSPSRTVQAQDIGFQASSIGGEMEAGIGGNFVSSQSGDTVQPHDMGSQTSSIDGGVGVVETGALNTGADVASGTAQTQVIGFHAPNVGVDVTTGASGNLASTVISSVPGQDMGFQASSIVAGVGGVEPRVSGTVADVTSGTVQEQIIGFHASDMGTAGIIPGTSGSFEGSMTETGAPGNVEYVVAGNVQGQDVGIHTPSVGAIETVVSGDAAAVVSGMMQGQDTGFQPSTIGEGVGVRTVPSDTAVSSISVTDQGQGMGAPTLSLGAGLEAAASGTFADWQGGNTQVHDMASTASNMAGGIETGATASFTDTISGIAQGAGTGASASNMIGDIQPGEPGTASAFSQQFLDPNPGQGAATDFSVISSITESRPSTFSGQFNQGSFGSNIITSQGTMANPGSGSSSTFTRTVRGGMTSGINRNAAVSISGRKIKTMLQSAFGKHGSVFNPTEIHPALLREYEYSELFYSEPCTLENIRNERTHFRVKNDPNKFIQCDIDGRMHLRSCNINHVFDVISSTCVYGPADTMIKVG